MICLSDYIQLNSYCLLMVQAYSLKPKTTLVSQLTNISHWICANKLSLNIGKSKCMLFQNTQNHILNHKEIILHGNKIEKVDNLNFLGIHIDKNLNWKKNTSKKCKKIVQLLALINKIKPLLQLCTLKQEYNALIQPHLSFCLYAWYSNICANLTKIRRLFKLQKKLFSWSTKANW